MIQSPISSSVVRSKCRGTAATVPRSITTVSRTNKRLAFRHAAGENQVVRAANEGRDLQNEVPSPGRRISLLSAISLGALTLLPAATPRPASADILTDALRGYTRPDVSVQDAVVILMDAKSTLKEIQTIAATPKDSEERFRARAFWPAYAKRLRAVAEAAPVVAGVVTGASDKEDTLSAYYGGKAEGEGVADAVYQGLGRVLTISGRTIRPEAQATPDAAEVAEKAIEGFLNKVPKPLLESAQQFRVERARAAGLIP